MAKAGVGGARLCPAKRDSAAACPLTEKSHANFQRYYRGVAAATGAAHTVALRRRILSVSIRVHPWFNSSTPEFMHKQTVEKIPSVPGAQPARPQWPNRVLTRPPRWCSVDLRDGNQALAVPMNVSQKLELFQTLVKIGSRKSKSAFRPHRTLSSRSIAGSSRKIARRTTCGSRCSCRRARI